MTLVKGVKGSSGTGVELKPIIIVCGGQWGSEAKGMVAAELGIRKRVDWAVRTGAVNAGHTVYWQGEAYKMQQLPTGWTNERTKLVLGPGAYINHDILYDEMGKVSLKVGKRLYIDQRAGLHEPRHTLASSRSGRHHRIGATGKGCSEAVMDRIRMRGQADMLWGTGQWAKILHQEPDWFDWNIADTEELLNNEYDKGKQILLEGTQGQGLDLLIGPWPYTTHKPCSPGQWLVENGLSPALKTEIVMVARTYPIRVAGNSGPMPGETDWWTLGKYIGRDRVSPDALMEWNVMCDLVAREWIDPSHGRAKLPKWMDTGQPNYRFEMWSSKMRVEWAEGLSEFHAEVMKRLATDTVKELGKVFEFTTVTKKLRRVAAWDHKTMKDMVRQIRPNYMVLTFLNYEFPELWGKEEIHQRALDFVRRREEEIGVEIRYVSTGPEGKHLIDLSL